MNTRRLKLLALCVGFALLPAAAVIAQDKPMIQEVKERGMLRAGVKNDAPYLGFVDEKGTLVGFEIDLITDIAKRLGVKIEFEPVKGSNRVQLLQQKRVDLLIATVSHYRSRDRVVDFTIPYLYTPQTLLVKKSSRPSGVSDEVLARMLAHPAEVERESSGRCRAFEHIGHGAEPARIARRKMYEREPCSADQVVGFPIQVTPARAAGPQRRQSVLPFGNARIGRKPVLDEPKLTLRLQYSSRFAQRCSRIWDAAE